MDGEVVLARSAAQEKLGEIFSLTRGKWQCTYDTKLCICAYVCLFSRLLLAIPDNHILRMYLCIVKLKEVKTVPNLRKEVKEKEIKTKKNVFK